MQGFETVLQVTGSTGVNVARHAGPSPSHPCQSLGKYPFPSPLRENQSASLTGMKIISHLGSIPAG